MLPEIKYLDKTNFNSFEPGETRRIFSYNYENNYFEDTLMIKNRKNECLAKIQTGIMLEKRGFFIPRIDKYITTQIS